MRKAVNDKRLRLAYITLGLEVGGQEKLLVEFARRVDRARFEGHLICLGERGPLADPIEACGWPVTALAAPPGLRPRLVWRLAKLFRQLQCDVVHTHDDKPLIYGVLAAQLAGVRRIIHTQHHGKLASLSRRQERLVAWASRGADCFVCVSHDSARQMIAQGVPAGRVRVLWNGVDLARFACHGPCPNGPIVTVARLSPEKDIANLLQTMAIVVRAEGTARLEIAGDGPCREKLLHLRDELGLKTQVAFLGSVRDMPALLQRASLFVLPSQTEGISLTLLEAMASGLPVVATRVGGNPEVVLDGVTGLVVPPRQPIALADAILQMRSNRAAAQRMGRAGRARAEAHFDVRSMVAAYESLYRNDEVAESQSAAAPTAARNKARKQACAS